MYTYKRNKKKSRKLNNSRFFIDKYVCGRHIIEYFVANICQWIICWPQNIQAMYTYKRNKKKYIDFHGLFFVSLGGSRCFINNYTLGHIIPQS